MEENMKNISLSLMGIGKELSGIREILFDLTAAAKGETPQNHAS